MSDSQRPTLKGITVPGKIVRFLAQHANLAFAGTRNRELVPYGHRVSGWVIEAGEGRLTALVAEPSTANLLESLQDNGELALTVEEFPSHETYQFKGRYLRHRDVQERDLEVAKHIRERFVKSLRHVYADAVEPLLRAFIQVPVVAVEFEVHEIYLQTPGPGAGTRLVPPAEKSA